MSRRPGKVVSNEGGPSLPFVEKKTACRQNEAQSGAAAKKKKGRQGRPSLENRQREGAERRKCSPLQKYRLRLCDLLLK